MQQGDTFLMGNPDGKTKHLWIILSDPMQHNGTFVIVNLTSPDGDHSSCMLKKGEHPWIKHNSKVGFIDALEIKAIQARKISEGIQKHIIIPQASLSANLVQRIASAAKLSPAFPDRLKAYL